MTKVSFRIIMALSILLSGIVLSVIAYRKHTSKDPLAHWVALSGEPAENAMILQQAEESRCIWRVTEETRPRRIAIQMTMRGANQIHQIKLRTEAGVLVGTSNGEWGGDLTLANADGVPIKRILDENVLQLLPSKLGTLVFTGLLHLGDDKGAVWLYGKDKDGTWSIKKIADLNGKPNAVVANDGGALGVSGHGIFHLNEALQLTDTPLPFARTSPNSIMADADGRIYVGMNAFVLKLIPARSGYLQEWYTRSGCLPQ